MMAKRKLTKRKFGNKIFWIVLVIIIFVLAIFLNRMSPTISKLFEPKDLYSCDVDSDCIKVNTDYCGSASTTINKTYEEWWKERLSRTGRMCTAEISYDLSHFASAKCIQGKCILDLEELEANKVWPIVMLSKIELKSKQTKEIGVGFYNQRNFTVKDASLIIDRCYTSTGLVKEEELPTITAPAQDVLAYEGVSYHVFIKENGLNPGTYLECKLVVESPDCTGPCESKKIILKVTE